MTQMIASQDSFSDSIYLPRLLISTNTVMAAIIPYSIVPKQKEKTTVDSTGSPVLVALAITKFMPPTVLVASATCPCHLVGRCTMLINLFHII
jgi:hypothetical protein